MIRLGYAMCMSLRHPVEVSGRQSLGEKSAQHRKGSRLSFLEMVPLLVSAQWIPVQGMQLCQGTTGGFGLELAVGMEVLSAELG